MSIKNILMCGASTPRSLVVLAHGYGASGSDLIGLAEYWAPQMPGTLFLSPDAPNACDINPMGYQWFSLGDWSPSTMDRNIQSISIDYNEFLNETLRKYDLPARAMALVGFSQGTMLSLHAALRRDTPLAGVLGYSGALIGDVPAAVPPFPVCLVHGDQDDVVPTPALKDAAQRLEKNGFLVESHLATGIGHGIDDRGLAWGGAFLRKILG